MGQKTVKSPMLLAGAPPPGQATPALAPPLPIPGRRVRPHGSNTRAVGAPPLTAPAFSAQLRAAGCFGPVPVLTRLGSGLHLHWVRPGAPGALVGGAVEPGAQL